MAFEIQSDSTRYARPLDTLSTSAFIFVEDDDSKNFLTADIKFSDYNFFLIDAIIRFDEASYRVDEDRGYLTVAFVSNIPVAAGTQFRLNENFIGISNSATSMLKNVSKLYA